MTEGHRPVRTAEKIALLTKQLSEARTLNATEEALVEQVSGIAELKRQLSEARADLNLLRDAGNELSTVLWGYDDSLAQEAIHAWNHAKQQATPEVPR